MGIFFIVALTIGVCGSVMGVMGIVAEVSYEWSKTFIEGGIKPLYWAMFFVALVYFIFWDGRTKVFERALALMVAIMGLCFILNFFILMPSPSAMLKGLIPGVPDAANAGDNNAFLIIASMVGTTLFLGFSSFERLWSKRPVGQLMICVNKIAMRFLRPL